MTWQPTRETDTHSSRQRGQTGILPGRPGAGTGATSRTLGIRRRRALPAGRAVVGGFLVAVAAVIVFAASLARTSQPGQRWVVAARALAPGTVLGPGDLTPSTMRLPSATAGLAYRQPASIEGRSLAVGLRPGELLQASMLVPSSRVPALRPVSLAVDPVSLGGLSAGQPVDVLMTQSSAGGGGAVGGGGGGGGGTASAAGGGGNAGAAGVTVIVRGATLLDVAPSNSSSLVPGSSGQVTIGVSTLGEVEAVVAAAHTGTVTLVAAEPSDGAGPGPGSASS